MQAPLLRVEGSCLLYHLNESVREYKERYATYFHLALPTDSTPVLDKTAGYLDSPCNEDSFKPKFAIHMLHSKLNYLPKLVKTSKSGRGVNMGYCCGLT